MKIISINGSPKGRKSHTHKMIKEILEGANVKGAEVENIFLSEMKIERCHGCNACWYYKKGCVIKDDMKLLLEKYVQSDVVIYGTPLHMDHISSLLKEFIDRCLPIISPYMEKDNNNEYRHPKLEIYKIPKFIIVSNGYFPEPSQFQVISHYFKRLARSMHTEVIAEIYRGQGLWLGLPKYSDNRPAIDAYNQLLNHAGEEIAVNGVLSEEVQLKLLKELAPYDEYVSSMENYWNKVLGD